MPTRHSKIMQLNAKILKKCAKKQKLAKITAIRGNLGFLNYFIMNFTGRIKIKEVHAWIMELAIVTLFTQAKLAKNIWDAQKT